MSTSSPRSPTNSVRRVRGSVLEAKKDVFAETGSWLLARFKFSMSRHIITVVMTFVNGAFANLRST